MRIVAGSRKGATIYAPKGRDTRPTSDRVREAAFAILGSVEGADVLDLFAGSGALGLEALSRGAASAMFVESDPAAVKVIERNLEKLGLEGAGRPLGRGADLARTASATTSSSSTRRTRWLNPCACRSPNIYRACCPRAAASSTRRRPA